MIEKVSAAFERLRATTFSDRCHRGHAVMPVEAWRLFERTIENLLKERAKEGAE